ncbi:MAG: RDD family protein [Mycobacterium sp.]|uniref:RDD family protein n=1 Tax=Mycobacterium sp. TaxID=1785 RepID=UPI0026183134|nr:RDD family protein [Mycobacterium sp.]MDI3313020.1 RDD family protein [Mycobacterium sp.]
MTAVVEPTTATQDVREASPNDLARWHLRAGAVAVDLLPGVAVVVAMGLTAQALAAPLRSTWFWSSVGIGGLAILLMAVNRLLAPAITGWSLGRAAAGIRVVGRDGAPVGPWRLLLRDLAHLLDTVSVLVGWLWPLWDARRRTFADLLLHTEVRRVGPSQRPAAIRRWTTTLVAVAVLVCASGAAVSYFVVYQRDRAVDQARTQIAVQGPKLVAEMLSYHPKTLERDFEHARSLTTDKYREQLATQQRAVKSGHPVDNEYWVTNSAVQSVTPDHATMLLFLQGRRGAPPGERFISATVRGAFVKGADTRWRIDDLTVLTKPVPSGNGK